MMNTSQHVIKTHSTMDGTMTRVRSVLKIGDVGISSLMVRISTSLSINEGETGLSYALPITPRLHDMSAPPTVVGMQSLDELTYSKTEDTKFNNPGRFLGLDSILNKKSAHQFEKAPIHDKFRTEIVLHGNPFMERRRAVFGEWFRLISNTI